MVDLLNDGLHNEHATTLREQQFRSAKAGPIKAVAPQSSGRELVICGSPTAKKNSLGNAGQEHSEKLGGFAHQDEHKYQDGIEADQSRLYAQSSISLNDKNKKGVLDAQELKRLGPSWASVDFDSDGKATIDKVQVRFQQFDAKRKKQQANKNSNPADSKPQSSGTSGSTAENHSGSIHDTPAGFQQLDADGDGQVQMHEFAKEFSDAVVRDFYQRDISRDGVITSKEWNRFLLPATCTRGPR